MEPAINGTLVGEPPSSSVGDGLGEGDGLGDGSGVGGGVGLGSTV